MPKKKLRRFAENATFSHFFQPDWDELSNGFSLRDNWNDKYFGNTNPLVIEVGCGKGEYCTALSEKYPNKNFIGIDKKGARMWRGAKTTYEDGRPNVAFVRTQAENLPLIFGAGEVDEIWITFPEPQPNRPRTSKRFTSQRFLDRYACFLKPGGVIHLKTDNTMFYEYTLDVIAEGKHRLLYANSNLYKDTSDPEIQDVIAVKTHYEMIWLNQGLTIKYLRFSLCNE